MSDIDGDLVPGSEFTNYSARLVFDQLETAGIDAFAAADMIEQVVMAGGDLDDLLDIAHGVQDESDAEREDYGLNDDDGWDEYDEGDM